jgi:hypothetical protein
MGMIVYRVVGVFPDGKKRIWRDFPTEQEAQNYILALNRGCSPCAKKSYGDLSYEKIAR